MAEIKQFLYTNNGTEIEFMQGFRDLICSLGDNITCEDPNGNPVTDVSTRYADTSGYADLIFNFGGGKKMAIVRHRRIIEGVSYFDYYPNYPSDSGYVYWASASSNYAYNASAVRSFFITYIKSEKVTALYVGGYAVTSPANASVSALRVVTDNDIFVSVVTGANLLASTLIGNNSSAAYSPYFQYAESTGSVGYANKAVFTSGGAKAFETEIIKPCTVVPQFSNLALPDGKNYFAIATNAMVEVDDEEE